MSRSVKAEPLGVDWLYHAVVFEFDHNEISQRVQVAFVVFVDGAFVVDVGEEGAALFVLVFVERVVPVRGLD